MCHTLRRINDGTVMKRMWKYLVLAAATGCGAGESTKRADAPEPTEPSSAYLSFTSPSPVASGVAATGPSLRVATYNVNYGMAGDPPTVAAIVALDVDMVFLQETNEAWERALASAKAVFPHQAFRHCCNAGGLAVLSKVPFSQEEYVHPDGAWFPAWRIVADTQLGRVQVVNVHLRPNVSDGGSVVAGLFTTPSIREAEIEHYIATLDEALPTLFVGDFNEPADGLAMQRLSARGMRSALPDAGGSQHTWRWQTSVGQLRKQFDHVVFDRQLRLVRAHVVYAGSSDHFPVIAELRRNRNLTSRK